MLHFNLLSIKTQKVISPSRRKINSFLFQHQGMHFISSPRGLIKGHDQRQGIGDGFVDLWIPGTSQWALSMGHFSGPKFTPAKRLRFDHQSTGRTNTGEATWGTARTTELSCRQHQHQLWFSLSSTQQHSSPGRTTNLAQT